MQSQYQKSFFFLFVHFAIILIQEKVDIVHTIVFDFFSELSGFSKEKYE